MRFVLASYQSRRTDPRRSMLLMLRSEQRAYYFFGSRRPAGTESLWGVAVATAMDEVVGEYDIGLQSLSGCVCKTAAAQIIEPKVTLGSSTWQDVRKPFF